jgi:hypothetical protein
MQLIHASWPSKGAGGSVTFLYKSGCGIETRNLPDSFKKKETRNLEVMLLAAAARWYPPSYA